MRRNGHDSSGMETHKAPKRKEQQEPQVECEQRNGVVCRLATVENLEKLGSTIITNSCKRLRETYNCPKKLGWKPQSVSSASEQDSEGEPDPMIKLNELLKKVRELESLLDGFYTQSQYKTAIANIAHIIHEMARDDFTRRVRENGPTPSSVAGQGQTEKPEESEKGKWENQNLCCHPDIVPGKTCHSLKITDNCPDPECKGQTEKPQVECCNNCGLAFNPCQVPSAIIKDAMTDEPLDTLHCPQWEKKMGKPQSVSPASEERGEEECPECGGTMWGESHCQECGSTTKHCSKCLTPKDGE